ncbi:RNA helicase required for poly(A+) mRNA export [Rhizophlyctis rosea]|nr:RNA helicase required for poly(A+) mRNA export [Rhizophlyctis rosea]
MQEPYPYLCPTHQKTCRPIPIRYRQDRRVRSHHINFNSDAPQSLCVALARELARQIMDVVKEMGKVHVGHYAIFYQGISWAGGEGEGACGDGNNGTVMELIRRNQLPVNNVRIFVLDEADNMLDQVGLGDHSIRMNTDVPAPPSPISASNSSANPAAQNTCSAESGGGGKYRTGKWRPVGLFLPGRGTCHLPHIRIGSSTLTSKSFTLPDALSSATSSEAEFCKISIPPPNSLSTWEELKERVRVRCERLRELVLEESVERGGTLGGVG